MAVLPVTAVRLNTYQSATGSVGAGPCPASTKAPAPVPPYTMSNCGKWYVARSGDNCGSIAKRFNLPTGTFMAWNPSVGVPSCQNMVPSYAYCVARCFSTTSPRLLTAVSAPLDSATESGIASTATSSNVAPSNAAPSNAASSNAAPDVYHAYLGDGSIVDGWPSMTDWIGFTDM